MKGRKKGFKRFQDLYPRKVTWDPSETVYNINFILARKGKI
jgi:hypothetical protein